MPAINSVHVPLNRYVTFTFLAGTGLVWDLYSKWIVFRSLGCCPGAGTWVWPDNWGWQWLSPFIRFQLHTNVNFGALWGMGQGKSLLFAGLSVLAAIGIPIWLFVFRGAVSNWLTVAMGFVMSGVLGNLYDRLGLHGLKAEGNPVYGVRDFLHFWFFEGTPAHFDWAIFNFADVFLVTGAIMLVVQSLLMQPSATKQALAQTTTSAPSSPSA